MVVDLPHVASVVSSHTVALPLELFPRVIHHLADDLVFEIDLADHLVLFDDLELDVVQVHNHD